MTTPAPGQAPPPPARRWRWVKKYVAGPVLAAAIGSGITVAGMMASDHHDDSRAAASTPKPTGKITSLNGKPVGQHVVLNGWIKNVPVGYALWAFVENPSNNRYYPTYSPCTIDDGTAWHCPELRPVPNGSPPGQTRVLHIALVTASGADQIGRYREKKNSGDSDRVLNNLTDGAIDIDSETITTS